MSDEIEQFRNAPFGGAGIVPDPALVDLDADPFVPKGWEVRPEDQLANRTRGSVDLRNVGLYLAEAQKKGFVAGEALRAELANQPILGANALDGYLKNPDLIPRDWNGKHVFFWGTIYRGLGGILCVRCLCWSGNGWDWNYHWSDGGWDSGLLAAILAGSL